MTEDDEGVIYSLLAVARSAYDLAEEALLLFEERRPAVIGYSIALPETGGKRLERTIPGPLERRGTLAAQAFLSNLVMVENALARLSKLKAATPAMRSNAELSLAAVKAVVNRKVRNTIEHLDERAANVGGGSLIAGTIVEGDYLCSTLADGTPGLVAITRDTLNTVARAINGIVQPGAPS